MAKPYHLFEVYGIELEYMLVNNDSFKVAPQVDELLIKKAGELIPDIENGDIAWSNELVAHVIELKTNGPANSTDDLSEKFHANILEINELLQPLNLQLLGSAAHPLMNPNTDTQLWKHSYSEVYALYNTIFNCKGHGWSNVQSTHINLPFFDDSEFEKLHAAIRIILPLIPGLSASSPVLEGKITGFKDSRLEFYKTNQKEIPELTGLVIPEQLFSKQTYHTAIFEPIKRAIGPYDKNKILDQYFLNSRGAIARFDRNAIEIRLIDIQECPKADIAICALIIEVLKAIVNKEFCSLQAQKSWTAQDLFVIFDAAIKQGEELQIVNKDYLKLFGMKTPATVQDVWKHLYQTVKSNLHPSHHDAIELILEEGTLATRLLKAIGTDTSEKHIISVYRQLQECLKTNNLFQS
ncbi:glutamate-cysteine ligase family protein [Ulvibacter litoralis]|uniref:Carboxylate-amine ligase n=1 Tax=Ulvibacter litoralis TaxID=227084 RepID=A0A1G7FHC0_9FLAO|nr:glutamate-cysteine ligase family protein [Ulvibacter litoralis]GHC51133.1 glutamate--cysteine ligase [Ulvibacter litoralis]SDE75283.1 carboxylate-amine ligase [Ulvibacter litoralis]